MGDRDQTQLGLVQGKFPTFMYYCIAFASPIFLLLPLIASISFHPFLLPDNMIHIQFAYHFVD